MNIMTKCPKCGQVITLNGVTEKAECSSCHAQLIINYEDLYKQRKRMKFLTVVLNIPALIFGFAAFMLGMKLGYIAATILLYQVVWVTIYRKNAMKKLKNRNDS